jgi:hypothetical protein
MSKVVLPKYQSIKIVEAAKIAKIDGQVMLLSFRKHALNWATLPKLK